jgi:hypothetical protein
VLQHGFQLFEYQHNSENEIESKPQRDIPFSHFVPFWIAARALRIRTATALLFSRSTCFFVAGGLVFFNAAMENSLVN